MIADDPSERNCQRHTQNERDTRRTVGGQQGMIGPTVGPEAEWE